MPETYKVPIYSSKNYFGEFVNNEIKKYSEMVLFKKKNGLGILDNRKDEKKYAWE